MWYVAPASVLPISLLLFLPHLIFLAMHFQALFPFVLSKYSRVSSRHCKSEDTAHSKFGFHLSAHYSFGIFSNAVFMMKLQPNYSMSWTSRNMQLLKDQSSIKSVNLWNSKAKQRAREEWSDTLQVFLSTWIPSLHHSCWAPHANPSWKACCKLSQPSMHTFTHASPTVLILHKMEKKNGSIKETYSFLNR